MEAILGRDKPGHILCPARECFRDLLNYSARENSHGERCGGAENARVLVAAEAGEEGGSAFAVLFPVRAAFVLGFEHGDA